MADISADLFYEKPKVVARELLGRTIEVKPYQSKDIMRAQLTTIAHFGEPNPRAPSKECLAPGTVLISTRYRGFPLIHIITGVDEGISHVTLWEGITEDSKGRQSLTKGPGSLALKLGILPSEAQHYNYRLPVRLPLRITGKAFEKDKISSQNISTKDYQAWLYWSYGVPLLD